MPASLRPARWLVGVLVVVLAAAPLAAAAQDLEGARDRAAAAQSALADATARYEHIVARVEEAADELVTLDRRADELAAASDRLDAQLAERARGVFMRGSTTDLALLLAAEGPEVAIERAVLAERAQHRDQVGLEEAVATRAALEQAVALAEQRRVELVALEAELAGVTAELTSELDRAESRVASMEQVAARQRAVTVGGRAGTYACPLDAGVTHFVDSWGFPRSGGRRHQGTDVMGPMGAPVYAFTDGVIARHSNSRLGGISLYLRGDDGSTYFYTHLQGFASGGAVGSRVAAGEHIAFNGNSGNARGGAPHIHFERHPGGGAAVNPYPGLAAACF